MEHIIKQHLEEHLSVASQIESLKAQIQSIAQTLIQALKDHNTIFWCGNGGYPTSLHISEIEKFGIIELHRKTFKPINKDKKK